MKRDWTSKSALLIVAMIVVVLNLAGLNLFARVDLTDDSVYSLSQASISLVENLEDPVTVVVFFTDNLPAPYSSNRRFLKDKLDDYRAYGGAKFDYRFEDPNSDEKLRQEAVENQIPPVQIQVIESDNVQLKNAYMGLVIQYGGKTERIPVIQDLTTLEYDITSAIRRLTRSSIPTVGFLTGHGEPDPEQDMGTLYQALGANYTVQKSAVSDGQIENVDALLVIAPADSLPEDSRRALDRYIMAGGRVAFLLNRISADLQSGQAAAHSVGLEDQLLTYGMGLKTDLVMDNQSSSLTVQRRQGLFNLQQQIPYPYFPVSTSFADDNVMVNRLQSLMFYFASSVDTSIAVPEGVIRSTLAQSSSRSRTQEGFFFVQPTLEQPGFSDGPFPLIVAYEGTFPSVFEPDHVGIQTRMVLIGDGDLLNESVIGTIPGNIRFGLNLIDWLMQDEALLAIRSKSIAARPLDETSSGIRPWIKYGNMLGPVLIVILFGLIRWRSRKRRTIVLAR